MKPEFDYFGNIASYNYMGYDFPTLAEAELLKKIHYQNNAHKEYYEIKRMIWPIGMPKFVNVKASLETGILQWYKREDIDLSYPNIKDNIY